MSDFFHFKSIAEVYKLLNLGKPAHPLITVIKRWPESDLDFSKIKMTSDLYLLSMKGEMSGAFKYGRNSYDYQEGTLVFIAPGQVGTFSQEKAASSNHGWSILFHPDLIRKSDLGKNIQNYSFFNYNVNEALHLSDKEREFLIELVTKIEQEINQNFDKHSQDLIIHNLESILKYSNRYYDRQFYTRTNLNKNYVSLFEEYLNDYFSSDELAEHGIPSVTKCGESLNLSGSYLSDLLKVETGRSAKDHIHAYIIEKAKTRLQSSRDSISEVAFGLGFEYPQHFSKLFKSKTGFSPSEYRNLN